MAAVSANSQAGLVTHIVFCDTVKSVKNAITILSTSEIIFMDCEGVELGVVGGSLSILSLGVISGGPINVLNIYLIDVTRLSVARLRPVFNLLASPITTKVVWDGRMDYSALFHGFGVHMQNVIDLQVVDVLSRASRDTPAQHFQRFNGYIQAGLLDRAQCKIRYAKLHRISSLLQAIKEHEPAGHQQFDKVHVDHEIWGSARPLPAEYIKYAAMDIEMIAALYQAFLSRRYIAPSNVISLTAKSSRYISFWADRQPTTATRKNYFVGNAFLPLELVDDISDYAAANPGGQKRKCGRCKRWLTIVSFSSPQTGRGGAPRNSPPTCWVCLAVAENMRHWQLRDRAITRRKAAAEAKAATTASLAEGLGQLTISQASASTSSNRTNAVH
ncbi:ribonuclease H-like domain-containing protein [Irpex lacteus]|nr:ribonuclease H-like domain-containing protein [Irpex lacteus]